jgi:phytanoyl-CoA hydroxylase
MWAWLRRVRRAVRARDPRVLRAIQELQEAGVTRVSGGFAPGVIEDVLASVKRMFERNQSIFGAHRDEQGHYPRIVNLHLLDKALLRLFAQNPLALAVQDAFFEEPSALYTSLYYERGSAQTLHRDTPYFSTRPDYRYLGVWVALEDADAQNGCLEVIRGGHLVPELDRAAIALRHYGSLDDVPPGSPAGADVLWDEYQAEVISGCLARGLKPELVEARAGDVIIWHPQLPHGGSQIRDLSRTRHSFVMHVTPYRTRVYQQDVFFNPGKQVPEQLPASAYRQFDGRHYMQYDDVDIGHRERRKLAEFAA